MNWSKIAPGVAALALLGGVIATAGSHIVSAQTAEIDPADFQTAVTNPYFPLASMGDKVIFGEEIGEESEPVELRLESKVLDRTFEIMGVTVTILEERAYEDGELVEVALDYFAQHKNGDVYYFGEHVDNYEKGVVANNNGQWIAGEGDNLPGVFMPADPALNQTLELEHAPGIAEDMATILSLTETVETPAGTYTNCLKTLDFTPLEPGLEEFKWYCPGAGLAKEAGDGFEKLLTTIENPAPVKMTPPSTGSGGLLRR